MGPLAWFALGGLVCVAAGIAVWFGASVLLVLDDMERRFQDPGRDTIIDSLGPKSWVQEATDRRVIDLRPRRGHPSVVTELQPDGCEEIDPDSAG